MGNFYLVVVDGLGVGAQPDSHTYGDQDANTLVNVCRQTGCTLPNLQKMGLGNIASLPSVPPVTDPTASYGKMREVSPGKDSTTGHWELAGGHLDRPFPTYPNGFPDEVISRFLEVTDASAVLCNKPYSGTEVIKDYGREHLENGAPIVYTSADSVFQIAAHVDRVPLERLYRWCAKAREKVMVDNHGVGRVIARPFRGEPGGFERISEKRKDYSMAPPEDNLVHHCREQGIATYSIGKIIDLFEGETFTQYRKTQSNAEGISQLLSLMSAVDDSLVFVNLIDTDQKYGHRLDPEGFCRCLQEFDRAIPALLGKTGPEDLLVITGDHGNDPTSGNTNHSREYVPLLVYPGENTEQMDLGIRSTFSDVAVSASAYFGLQHRFPGHSFLTEKRTRGNN